MDDAMRGVLDVLDLMRITDPEQARAASQRYGIAALRVTHQWAKASAESHFGTDVAWLRNDEIKGRVNLQEPEVVRLEAAIRNTTDSSIEDFVGEVSMVDWDGKSFRMKSGDREIAGPFDESVIDALRPASVPGFYAAKIRVERRLLADGDATPTYTLLDLAPLVPSALRPSGRLLDL